MKNRKYYFFDEITNIKHLEPNNINTEENPVQKYYLLHWIGYVKQNSVKPLYLITYNERK